MAHHASSNNGGFDFVKQPTERPDPSHFLRKREGSPGGLKPAAAGSQPGSPGRIRAARPAAPLPPPAAAPAGRKARPTLFRKRYDRGELPVRVDQDRPGRNGLKWTADLSSLDLHLYLPIFVEGLGETQEPYRMLARRGVEELLTRSPPDRLLPVVPQLIMGLRGALKSADADVVQAGLHTLSLLVGSCEGAGAALVPYYRQLLPPLASHVGESINIGDQIDYGQAGHRGSLGDLVGPCLAALERTGGPDAYLNIKYYVPTYESVLRPSRMTRKA